MPLLDDLRDSALRWAGAALDAYTADPQRRDFAVHHMAVAVEHLSKAYLCSVSDMLLVGDRPRIDDLLVLAGRSDKSQRPLSDIKTIGGGDAIARAEWLLDRKLPNAEELKRLREARNGVSHIGLCDEADRVRSLLASGIEYVNILLAELGHDASAFWGSREGFTQDLVAEALSELELRVREKIRRAKEIFDRRFGSLGSAVRDQQIKVITQSPLMSRWALVSPMKCPACGSPAFASGREYSDEFGSWFNPRFFGCRACELRLEEAELEHAGITGQYFDDHEYDQDWEPDPDDLRDFADRSETDHESDPDLEPDPDDLRESADRSETD